MKEVTELNFDRIKVVAGVVTVFIVAYYVSGVYLNYLEIKKLREEKK
jgi:hypothetical protein